VPPAPVDRRIESPGELLQLEPPFVWTVRRLFARLTDPGHLDRAADLTVRGKRRRADVAWFLFRREAELARLQAELAAGRYRPEGFELVTIRDPKPRLIARVPIADRVVQTALVDLMQSHFLRSLRPEAYACRPGFGTHRAVLRLLELVRRYPVTLHLDIRNYFPSIDRELLRNLVAMRIRDRQFLAVIERVLAASAGIYDRPEARAAAGLGEDWPPPSRGIAIGSYTSQMFAAHVYLSEFDHFVKRELGIPGYLRYVDDLFLFGHGRADLRAARRGVGDWLAAERGLRLKHPQARVLSCRGHLDGLGYRISRSGIQALPRAFGRLRRRIELELAGAPGPDLERSLAASAGVILF
jgi:hypothetical protein